MKELLVFCFLVIPVYAMSKDRSEQKKTLLNYLVHADFPELKTVQSLLKIDARCCQVDPIFRYSVLGWAVQVGNVDIVRMILATKKVDINAGDIRERTPLMVAARLRHVAIVRLLLAEKGILVTAVDKWGRSALDYVKALEEDSELDDPEKYIIFDLLSRAGAKLHDGKIKNVAKHK